MKKILDKNFYEQLGRAFAGKIRADAKKVQAWKDLEKAENLRRQANKDLDQAEADWDKATKETNRIAKWGDKL